MNNYKPTANTRTLISSAIGVALTSLIFNAQAQTPDEQAPNEKAPKEQAAITTNRLDSVVVLGTRSRDTTVLTSTAPVDVIGGEELAKTGATTLNQALWQLVPSFNFPQNQPTTRGLNPKGASLRGLSTDQTLVLVNGKRRHASSMVQISSGLGLGTQPVDLDAIPFSAIERIEVLRDGASAQYGSDAIAGVINIILKGKTRSGVTAQVGKFAEGQGLRRSTGAWGSLDLPGNGFVTGSVDVLKSNPTDNSKLDTAQHYFSGDAREATVDRRHPIGSPEREIINLALNAEASVSEDARLYGFATYGHGDARNNVIGVLYPRSDWNVRDIYPNGAHAWYKYRNEDISATGGVRIGDESTGLFDLSAGYGSNDHQENIYDTVNPSYGLGSPTSFLVAQLKNEQKNLALDYVRDFDVRGLSGPLTISSGVAYRHERYTLGAGDYDSYANGGQLILDGPNQGKPANGGAYQGQGLQELDAGSYTRGVKSFYLGAETLVTPALTLNLTGRTERYSDFGSTTNGKLSARYEFTPQVAVRGTLGTGYRAPSLGQVGTSWTTSTGSILAADGTPLLTRIVPVNNSLARSLGATDLKPEKSTDMNIGLVLKPSPNSWVTLDAYDIRIRDRVTLSERLSGSKVQDLLNSAGYKNYAAVQFMTNAAATRTRGFDLASRYLLGLNGYGEMELSASYAQYRTEVTDVKTSPNGLVTFGRSQTLFLEKGQPESRLLLSSKYTLGSWSALLAISRFGSYMAPNAANPALDQNFSPLWKTDIDFGFKPTANLGINVGVENIFDKRPEESIDPASRIRYGTSAAVAPEGAFVYTRLSYDF